MRRRNEECLITWCGGQSAVGESKGKAMGGGRIGSWLSVACGLPEAGALGGLWKGGTGWRKRGSAT